MNWIKKRTRLEKLKEKYQALMRRAFEIAPKNKPKSDRLNKEARMLLRDIRQLEME